MLASFTKCSREEYKPNTHVKSFVNTAHAASASWSPHHFEYDEGYYAGKAIVWLVLHVWSWPSGICRGILHMLSVWDKCGTATSFSDEWKKRDALTEYWPPRLPVNVPCSVRPACPAALHPTPPSSACRLFLTTRPLLSP